MIAKRKSDGAIVYIDSSAFDPAKYEPTQMEGAQDPYENAGDTQTNQIQQQRQQAWQSAGNELERNRIAEGFKSAYGYELFGTPDQSLSTNAQKQKDAQKVKDDMISVANQITSLIQNKGQYTPKAYQDALNSLTSSLVLKKKEADNLGAALTGTELSIMAGGVPVQQQIGMSAGGFINKLLTGREPVQRGEVVDDEATLLNKMKLIVAGLSGEQVTPEMLNSIASAAPAESPSISGLIGNAGADIKETLNSILGIPAAASEAQNQFGSMTPAALSSNPETAVPALQTILSGAFPIIPAAHEANQLLGRPLEGGDIVGRAAQRAYEKPVTTVADLLTILGLTKAARGTPKVPTTKTPAGPTSIAKRGIEKASEVVSGGGSKEYVARQAASKNALPQKQVLMEEGVLKAPTETGRIAKASQALARIGSKIQDTYAASKNTLTGSDIGIAIDGALSESGYDQKAINFIKRYITQKGKMDLKSGESIVEPLDLWNTAKRIEENPPKMVKNPETASAYRQLAVDAAREIRRMLADMNPKIKDLNARYSALRDYLDNVLGNPKGINLKGGLFNIIGEGVKSVADPTLAQIYSILGFGKGNQ